MPGEQRGGGPMPTLRSKHAVPQPDGVQGGHGLQSRKIRNIWNWGSMTGCLIRGVTKYSIYWNTCVWLPFQVIPFGKDISHNRIKLTKGKDDESSTSDVGN